MTILSWRLNLLSLNLLSLHWLSHLLRAELLGQLLNLLLHLLHLLQNISLSLNRRTRVVLIILLRGVFHEPLL